MWGKVLEVKGLNYSKVLFSLTLISYTWHAISVRASVDVTSDVSIQNNTIKVDHGKTTLYILYISIHPHIVGAVTRILAHTVTGVKKMIQLLQNCKI